MTKLKLIKTKYFSGYILSDIKTHLGKTGFNQFEKWMFGETVAVYKGEPLVYKYDFDRYIKGLRPLDSL